MEGQLSSLVIMKEDIDTIDELFSQYLWIRKPRISSF